MRMTQEQKADQEKRLRDQGAADFRAGLPPLAPPLAHTQAQAEIWYEGWLQAKKESGK